MNRMERSGIILLCAVLTAAVLILATQWPW